MGVRELESFAGRFARAASSADVVRAVFLGGSLATGTADEHSDVDLYVIAEDGKLQAVCALVPGLLTGLDKVLFLRHVDHGFPMYIFICSDGTRGEIGVGEAGQLPDLHFGAYRTLFDRDGILDGYVFPGWPLVEETREAYLLSTLDWFWRAALNAAHYISRGDPWPAAEELAQARNRAATLLRLLRPGPSRPAQGLHRLSRELPPADRAALADSYVPLEHRAMATALAGLCSLVDAAGRQEAPGVADRHRLESLAELVKKQIPLS